MRLEMGRSVLENGIVYSAVIYPRNAMCISISNSTTLLTVLDSSVSRWGDGTYLAKGHGSLRKRLDT